MDRQARLESSRQKINWGNTVGLFLFHVGAVVALLLFQWQAVAVAALLYWLAIGCGIGMGYHRLLTHRSY